MAIEIQIKNSRALLYYYYHTPPTQNPNENKIPQSCIFSAYKCENS